MDQEEKNNWAKICESLEKSGDTESAFYRRARSIVDGEPDPLQMIPPPESWSPDRQVSILSNDDVMPIEPIERGLEQAFQSERLVRWINDCQDLEELREAALSLVQQLAQQKAAGAWMASRASESENSKLKMLAELIKRADQPPSRDSWTITGWWRRSWQGDMSVIWCDLKIRSRACDLVFQQWSLEIWWHAFHLDWSGREHSSGLQTLTKAIQSNHSGFRDSAICISLAATMTDQQPLSSTEDVIVRVLSEG
jgi:hypothetical protein